MTPAAKLDKSHEPGMITPNLNSTMMAMTHSQSEAKFTYFYFFWCPLGTVASRRVEANAGS